MQIEISLIQETQFGFYYCVVEKGSVQYTIKKALNYKGPYFGSLWDKYEKNVIVSCSATGAFLVLAISLCALYTYKYPDEAEDVYVGLTAGAGGQQEAKEDKVYTVLGTSNQAYVEDSADTKL